MTHIQHWAIFVNNQSKRQAFINDLMSSSQVKAQGFCELHGKRGALFSKMELDKFIEEEARHDNKLLTSHTQQSLESFSSGERKKALFRYLLDSEPEFLVLDDPFDNLDRDSQADLKDLLLELSKDLPMVQILSRQNDLLPFINRYGILEDSVIHWYSHLEEIKKSLRQQREIFTETIPAPLEYSDYGKDYLIQLKDVNISYGDKPILQKINWDIKPGEFWELAGKNGSGKTTILSMITGDNPKGYGQELYLFGQKKGSGESIWDIKKKIGYFTPSMIDRFRGYHSLENMLISGILDSIGLYIIPNEAQIRLARQWLNLIGLADLKDSYFHDLSIGQQRLIMCVRAMIKHPLLLILDEPTAGLDDASASLIIALVNKMAAESDITIIFVSHRKEKDLNPEYTYQLSMGEKGSTGRITANNL